MLIGCNGLIGERLTKQLLQQGKTVVGYSRSRPVITHPNFAFYSAELSELSIMIRVMQYYQVEAVIHNAALSHPKMAENNPYKMFQINLIGVLNSIEAASVTNVKRFLFCSAAGVYGNNVSCSISETAPLKSQCAYDSSKIAAEEVVKNYGIECGILRIGFVYGPGRTHECPIAMLLRDVQKTGKAHWNSGSDQHLDYIHIEDTIAGMIGAVNAPALHYKIYNLGGGQFTPFNNVIDIVRTLYPSADIQVGPGGLGYDDIGCMDNSRAREDFGYEPSMPLESGVKGYAQWLLEKDGCRNIARA